MRRQFDFNAYSVFARRATMMDMEENMMMRLMKPMRTTTTISQRGNAYTQMLDKQKSFFCPSTLFSITICLSYKTACERLPVTSCLTGHHHVCALHTNIT